MISEVLIAAIVSSSVFTAIISGLINFIKSRRESKLERITDERKLWREEIREICDTLTSSNNLKELKAAIGKLKVRINIFGLNEISEEDNKEYDTVSFNHDAYIWQSIRKVEKEYFDMNERNELVIKLSLLLKYDWERTKKEVNGERNGWYKIFLCSIMYYLVMGIPLLIAMYKFRSLNNVNNIQIILLMILLNPLFVYSSIEVELFNLKNNTKVRDKFLKIIANVFLVISKMILVFFPNLLYLAFVIKYISLHNLEVSTLSILALLFFVISYVIIFTQMHFQLLNRKEINNIEYLKFLNKKSN